uniref:Not1 domain-containing protein n=1 Tax=Bursaphelenchus xylophilus TaxID=6326 RepID=A0A1I7SA09_BURXY
MSFFIDFLGCFRLFTSITDQLRNASTHTAFYASMLLHLFHTAHSNHVREIITRILLERLLANRPHPFGIKLVMAELLRNPDYKFMEFEFVHSAEVVERMVISISKYLGVEINEERSRFFKYHNPRAARKEPQKRQSDSNNNKQAKRSYVRAATPMR